MKVRVFHRAEKVVVIEHDPRFYQNGQYSDSFFPGTFLKDVNNRAAGYQDVPDWFVTEADDSWIDKPFEFLEVRTDDQGEKYVYFKKRSYSNSLAAIRSKEMAFAWKHDILIETDWTTVPLATYERKMIIGVPLTDEEIAQLVEDWNNRGE